MANAGIATNGRTRRRAWLGGLGIVNTVLFACVHNVGLSQRAAVCFNLLTIQRRLVLSPPAPIPLLTYTLRS
jgi:hypothetical protein